VYFTHGIALKPCTALQKPVWQKKASNALRNLLASCVWHPVRKSCACGCRWSKLK